MKLIQITDTHLLADPAARYRGWNTWQSLQAVLGQISARHNDLAGLLLTGDLVHDESVAGYRRLARRLHHFNVPVLALPGNHDRPARLQQLIGLLGRQSGREHRFGDWRVLLMSSHWPGQVGGRITRSERLAIDNALRREAAPTLLCVHHPPMDMGSAWLDRIGLEQRPQVQRWLSSHPHLAAVVCGHVHQAADRCLDGLRILTTPSTCRQFLPASREFAEDDRPPGYRVLQLGDDGQLSTWIERLPDPPVGRPWATQGCG